MTQYFYLNIKGHYTTNFYKSNMTLTANGTGASYNGDIHLTAGIELPNHPTYRPYTFEVLGYAYVSGQLCVTETHSSTSYNPENYYFINNSSSQQQYWYTQTNSDVSNKVINSQQICTGWKSNYSQTPYGTHEGCSMGYGETRTYLTWPASSWSTETRARGANEACTDRLHFISGVACSDGR